MMVMLAVGVSILFGFLAGGMLWRCQRGGTGSVCAPLLMFANGHVTRPVLCVLLLTVHAVFS